MKAISKIVLACLFLSSICVVSTYLIARREHNPNPFHQLIQQLNHQLNELAKQQIARQPAARRRVKKSAPKQKVRMAFFDDPFFNDPFFSDPFFDDPFFQRFFNRRNKNSKNNHNRRDPDPNDPDPDYPDQKEDDDAYSHYIIISIDPNQTTTQAQDVQDVQQVRPATPRPRPRQKRPRQKHERFQPRPPQNQSPFGGLFPLFGNQGHHGHGQQMGHNNQQYQQYKPEDNNNGVTFEDVIGQTEAIHEVTDIVDFLKNPDKYHRLGAEIPKGVLFEGPPGTGKTLLARAVANEAGCTFIHASGSQFINKYVGTGADNIRKLFEQARKQAPAIIFIDELDAIGSRQGDENQEYRHTINELLSQMDGFKQEENVIVLAATNYKLSLDRALLRPGRFDRIVKFSMPNRKDRRNLLRYYMKKKLLNPDVNIEDLVTEFAPRTPGFSGADIKKLANEAALLACREDALNLSSQHFEQAYDKIVLGPKNHLDRTKEQLRQTAYHEIGHVVVKLKTDQPLAKVSILSRGDTLGVTLTKEKYETMSEYKKEELMDMIKALYGGFIAEKHFLNSTRPGASDDLDRVRKIARYMIRDCGMGEGELEGFACPNGQFKDLPEDLKNKIVAEELKLMNQCKEETQTLFAQNENLVHTLVEKLVEKETLSANEIKEIAQAHTNNTRR